MATATKPQFKVPRATNTPKPETRTGPTIPRPFKESDLHGFSDDDLRSVLRLQDLFDPQREYNAERIAERINRDAKQVLQEFWRRDDKGHVIRGVRGRGDTRAAVFGSYLFEWFAEHPEIKPDPDAFALRVYRAEHPELFQEPSDQLDLIGRMRREREKIERDLASEERRRQRETYLNEKFGRLGDILSRFHCPTDADVTEMVVLCKSLNLLESDIIRIMGVIESAHKFEKRLEQCVNGVDDRRAANLKAELAKLATVNFGLFDMTGDLPRLKYPPKVLSE